jgi:effector-binding domain-containing protein
MQVRIHPAVMVLTRSYRTTLKELHQFTHVSQELYAEAAGKALVSGPVYWVYRGADGHPDTLFTLDIALPIQGFFNTEKSTIRELPAFKAVVCRHEGPWEQLPSTYEKIMEFVEKYKIPIRDECRELYINVDFQQPSNNITEVQVGVV